MVVKNLSNWNQNYRHDGMLFFTQRIEEMLFHYSNHLYRTPVLNTYLLVQEYIDSIDLLKQNDIRENHIKNIIDEFKITFCNDVIIQKNIDEKNRQLIIQNLNQASRNEEERIMRYMNHKLRHYNLWCKQYLEEIVEKPKEKKKIDKALRSYIPGLIGAGYSQEFIYHFNRKVFVKQPVESLNSLYCFLDRFDFEKRSYTIYVGIKKEALAFKQILRDRLNVKFDEGDNAVDLNCDREKYSIISIICSALDEQVAATAAYDHLEIFFRYYNYISKQNEDWLFPIGKIIDEKGEVSFLPLQHSGFNYAKGTKKKELGYLSAAISGLLSYKSKESFETINRAVDVHNLAISERDLKNGFLNLWSILEMLFVSEHDSPKITEIEHKIMPILQRDYFSLAFSELGKYISDSIAENKLEEIKSKISAPPELWLQYLIILPDYEDLRKTVYAELADYPLIRSRMSTLNECFSKKENTRSLLDQYTQRLQWHIRRLYRARNAAIHSGNIPGNIKALGEHLLSYVDECLSEIVLLIAIIDEIETIDDVVIRAQMKMALVQKQLSGKGELSKEDIAILFENPLESGQSMLTQ